MTDMKPWDDNDVNTDYDENHLKDLWNNINLNELSFAIVIGFDGEYYVAVAPNEFAKDGKLHYAPMFNEKLLNLFDSYDLAEDMSSIYSGENNSDTIEALKKDLLTLGLLESDKLAKAVEYQYNLDDDDDVFDADTVDLLPASKFIFAIDEKNIDPSCPNFVPVVITPVDYYNENQCAWYDEHFHILEFDELNKLCDFGNEAESQFSFDQSKLSINDFRNKMLELGFQEELYLIGIDDDKDCCDCGDTECNTNHTENNEEVSLEPERIELADRIEYRLNGMLHREDGPALEFTDGKHKGLKKYFQKGLLHREDGPAVEHPDGTLEYGYRGLLHRMDGPAVINADGKLEYFIGGKRFRDDGPAIEYPNGEFEYWFNNKLHREDGPAVYKDKRKIYYNRGVIHRGDGPAVEYDNGNKEYYFEGKLIEAKDNKDFKRKTKYVDLLF